MRRPTLLATCRVLLRIPQGEFYAVRILIDQGSELSFVSEKLVQRFKIERRTASIPLCGVGGTHSGFTKGIVSIELSSIHNSNSSCIINAYVLPRVTAKLPSFSVTTPFWPHIEGLQLADPGFARMGPIHIIIGSDYYGSVIMSGLKRGESSSPIAQQTLFGWVLSGPIAMEETVSPAQTYHCSSDYELQELITKFWSQEEIPAVMKSPLRPEEEECEKHFVSTFSRDSTGRYIVRLPLKSSPTTLGNLRSKALGCLN